MIKPPLPYGGVTLSVALTFEDALVEEGEEEPGYWTYARVMAESLGAGRSIFFFFYLFIGSQNLQNTYIFKIHHTDRTITIYKQNTNTEPAFKFLEQKQCKFQINTLPETL